jgi:hypothetical protein
MIENQKLRNIGGMHRDLPVTPRVTEILIKFLKLQLIPNARLKPSHQRSEFKFKGKD